MATEIKERFLSAWDKDLSDIWKYIVPVLPDIRHRSGNDAAATLCTFSKNWRTNRKEIRTIYDIGVAQREKEIQAQNEEKKNEEDSEEDKKDSESDDTSTSEMGGKKNKSSKDSENRRTASGKRHPLSSPDRYIVIASNHRPLSPLRMRSPYNALPHARAQPPGKRARPKSSKKRYLNTEAHGHREDTEETKEQDMKDAIKAGEARIEELEAQLHDMHTAHDQMEQDIKELQADKTRLVDRVAELNEIKVAHDERELQLKGVTQRNSPLKVAQEYELLYNNEWLDAKQALDEYSDWKVKDKDKYEILTSTLTECYQMATGAFENHRAVLVKLLNDPFAAARHPLKLKKRASVESPTDDVDNGNCDDTVSQAPAHRQDLSPELEEAVLRYMKIQCDAMDFRHTSRYVIASVFATLHPLLIDHDITKSARVKHFVRASLQLCWKMVIQDPPLTFDLSQIGEGYDDDRMELHPSSDPANTPNAVVDHYVYPAMLQGDKKMQKALVILAAPEDEEAEF